MRAAVVGEIVLECRIESVDHKNKTDRFEQNSGFDHLRRIIVIPPNLLHD
jgi:hypothetical protein